MNFAKNILAANLLSVVCAIAASVMVLRGVSPWAWAWFLLLSAVSAHSARGDDNAA